MSLEPEVAERVLSDFREEQVATVTELLESCGTDFGGKRDNVQRAILKLADGDLDLLRHYVEDSRTDFRDVVYWAFGWEHDRRRILWELRRQLLQDGILSDEEDGALGLIGTHEGLPPELERLCEILQQGKRTVTAEQYATIQKLARTFRLRAAVWKPLAPSDA